MELFDEIATIRASNRLLPRIGPDADTPLGTVVTGVTIDGEAGTPGLPSTLRALSGRTTHHVWRGAVARAELLRVELDSSVDGAVAFLWRLATWREIGALAFHCQWAAPPTAGFVRPTLAAAEVARWESARAVVAIGTEPVDQLARRAAVNDGFPARLVRADLAVDISTNRTGSTVTIAGLERHEQCQIQFVVAWGPPHSAGTVTAAVARAPSVLLAAAAGR